MRYEKGKIFLEKGGKCPLLYDFFLWGTFLSCLINLFDRETFFIWQIELMVLLAVLYDIKKTFSTFIHFVKRNYILTISFLIWFAVALLSTSIIISFRLFSIYLIIFFGYLFAEKVDINGLEKSFKRFILITVILGIFGIICYAINYNPLALISSIAEDYLGRTERLTAIWLHPIPAACFLGVMLIFSAYYCSGLKRIILFIISIIAILLTQTRSMWLILLLLLIVCNFKKIFLFFKNKCIVKKQKLIMFLTVFALIIIFSVLFYNSVLYAIGFIHERLFGQNLDSDMSFIWRMNSILTISKKSFTGDLLGLLFGHGMFSGSNLLGGLSFGSKFSYNVGAVDNSFISALYDFGLLGLIWLILCLIWVIKLMLSSKKILCSKVVATTLVMLLLMSLFFEELYWCNISFVVFTLIGIELNISKKEVKKI